MKRRILAFLLGTLLGSIVGTMRVEASELLPADFDVIESKVEIGITIQMLRNIFYEGKYYKAPYYITGEGEDFKSISKRLSITEEELILENLDYRPQEDGTFSPFVEHVYISIPKICWEYVSEPVYFYISKGDTLYGISDYFGIKIEDILKANPQIVDANKIYADTVIKIK